ncbi:MAG: hypothetical protein K2W92_08130 [Alphaproteobacteria bacterium]|nr:hypothetical protein [Alphaproteobacteria bacterium]
MRFYLFLSHGYSSSPDTMLHKQAKGDSFEQYFAAFKLSPNYGLSSPTTRTRLFRNCRTPTWNALTLTTPASEGYAEGRRLHT